MRQTNTRSNIYRKVADGNKHSYWYWGEIPEKRVHKVHKKEIHRRGRRVAKVELRKENFSINVGKCR